MKRFVGSFLFLIVFVILGIEKCRGYRILGIFPLNMRSHFMMFEQIMKGLARRGHQVDVVSQYPLGTSFPNYTDIVIPPTLRGVVNNVTYENFSKMITSDLLYFFATEGGSGVCEIVLKDYQIQNLIKNPPKDPPYDLVIMEIGSANCFAAFGRHLNVPVIGITSSTLYPWSNDIIGNPENLAITPNTLINFIDKMNFWERLYNVVHTYWAKLYLYYYSRSTQNEIIKKYFGENTPGVKELEESIALVLANTHPSLNGAKPTVPALIEVGGLHIQDDGPEISEADKKWLDESTHGFIYFTFGSMVMIETFPPHILDTFYKSFSKLAPMRILMKVPRPELLPPGLPRNIRTFSWIPQFKVLKHKNIRAFINHGGLMGPMEAIACAVPMIGIPLFADQFINADLYVHKNIAIKLHYEDMTEEKLDTALHQILFNSTYREASRKLAKIFFDRPTSALDTACFWVEYIIRHGDKILRSQAMDLTWWQIALLDVYGALLFFITLIFIILMILARLLFKLCIKKIHSSQSNSKKQKMS